MNRSQKYYVKGMNCRSCEILIENKISKLKNIKNVKANINKNEVIVEYEYNKPDVLELNNLFDKEGYKFFENKNSLIQDNNQSNNWNFILGMLILIFGIWFVLNNFGFFNNLNLDSNSSLIMFFVLGLVAGFSTCGSLVGGILLSLSKKWHENYNQKNHWEPYIMFNISRLLSYGFFGGLLGFLGKKISLSFGIGSFLVILVSIIMIFLSLEILGIKFIHKIKIGFPKFLGKLAFRGLNYNSRLTPFFIGALTFFLPCGFTLTAQSLALISGSVIKSFWIMFLFALGTLPALGIISFSSIKIFNNTSNWNNQFSKILAIIILIFAIYNINSQLNVLGAISLNDLAKNINQQSKTDNNLPSIIDGKQVIKMNASSFSYSPNYFIVRSGIPVRWEITDSGSSGCINVIIARGLLNEQINLISNQTVVKEFIPQKPGKYKFSCWMGMISGIIEVISN